MAANDNTLVQSNFKDLLGSLHNVYGSDEHSYDTGLAILESRIARLTAIGQQFQGASVVAQVLPLAHVQPPAEAPAWVGLQAAMVAPAAPAPAWGPPAAPAFAAAAVPSCSHGPRTPRSGVGQKGPWRAWFCPTPKGTPGQCDASWVQQNTAEWVSFPA